MDCPKCGDDCCRDTFDTCPPMFGPWKCDRCGWQEDQKLDDAAAVERRTAYLRGWREYQTADRAENERSRG